MKWFKRIGLGLVGLITLFTAAAYFWLPGFVQSQASKVVHKELGRNFVLGELHINPLNLKVQAKNITLYELDGKTPFVSVKQIDAQASWASLWRMAPVLDQLQIDQLQARVVRTGEQSFNFSDIQAKLAAKPPSDPARFALNNITLQNSRLNIEDTVVKQVHTVSDLKLSLPFVSSLAHDTHIFVKPHLSLRLDDKLFVLDGQTKPFEGSHESALSIDLKEVNLVPWLAYSPVSLPFSVRSAMLQSLALAVQFKQSASTQLEIKGALALGNLVLTEKASTKPVISLANLKLQGIELAPLQRTVKAQAVLMDGLNVAASADAQGIINLQQLFAFAPQAAAKKTVPAAGPAPAPWQLSLAQVSLNQSSVQLLDARYSPSLRMKASDIRVSAQAVQWPLPANAQIGATLDADLTLGEGKKPTAKLNLSAQFDATRAVTAAVQLNSFALESLAPILQQNKLALDLAGLAQLKAKLNYNAKGELTSPQADLTIANLRLGLPQSATPLLVQKTVLQLKNSTLLPTQALNTSAAFSFADQSYAKAAGKINLSAAPLQAALKIDLSQMDAMPILALVPQALSGLNLRPSSGFVSALGDVSVNGSAVQWQGSAALDKVQVLDEEAQDLLKIGKLTANNMRIDTAAQPMALHLGAISLQEGFAKLLLNAQGKLNLTGLVKTNPTAPGSEAAKQAVSPAAPAPLISLDGISIVNTAVDFTDQFIKPNYRAQMSQLTGSVGAMSSALAQAADVSLKGGLQGNGDLTVSGKINPLASSLYTDLTAKASNIELTQLSPYSAKYADYNIVKGKLSAEVKYLIDQGKLTASNKIKIDQLTFGDSKIGSADATKLPVKLAVALLKDRKGVIDIDLPISGSLSDPKFSVGSLIWQVLGNLLVKAVTSPFALLGSLFGGGESLSYLDFAPGSAALDEAGKKKLDSLAKALNDRPALSLDILGRADASVDAEGLRTAWVDEQLRTAKLKALLKQNKSLSEAQVQLLAGDEKTYLEAAYKEAPFTKPKNLVGITKSLPPEDMRKLMLANAPVNADDVKALAAKRASAVQTYLQTSVDKAQLFVVLASGSAAAPKDAKPSRVDFALK